MRETQTQFMDESKRLYPMTKQQATGLPIQESGNRSRWLKKNCRSSGAAILEMRFDYACTSIGINRKYAL